MFDNNTNNLSLCRSFSLMPERIIENNLIFFSIDLNFPSTPHTHIHNRKVTRNNHQQSPENKNSPYVFLNFGTERTMWNMNALQCLCIHGYEKWQEAWLSQSYVHVYEECVCVCELLSTYTHTHHAFEFPSEWKLQVNCNDKSTQRHAQTQTETQNTIKIDMSRSN